MAILKFINDPADFSLNTASLSTNPEYFEATRCDGWLLDGGQGHNLAAEWPAAAGNDLWIHFVCGYSSTATAWIGNEHLRLEDGSGNLVASSDIRSGNIDWNLYGDTTNGATTYRTITRAPLVMDLHFVRTGTTSMQMFVYVNGTFQGSPTVGNTVNFGLPTNIIIENLDVDGDYFFGECVIADEDTRGWRLFQLKPTAFGVNQEWDGTAASVVDGSLLTGITTDVANERASFGVSRIENIPDDALIDRVCIQSYGQRGASGLTAFNHYFRYESGTTIDDADHTLALTAGMFIDEYTTDPNTTLPWAVPNLSGLQIGVRART